MIRLVPSLLSIIRMISPQRVETIDIETFVQFELPLCRREFISWACRKTRQPISNAFQSGFCCVLGGRTGRIVKEIHWRQRASVWVPVHHTMHPVNKKVYSEPHTIDYIATMMSLDYLCSVSKDLSVFGIQQSGSAFIYAKRSSISDSINCLGWKRGSYMVYVKMRERPDK